LELVTVPRNRRAMLASEIVMFMQVRFLHHFQIRIILILCDSNSAV